MMCLAGVNSLFFDITVQCAVPDKKENNRINTRIKAMTKNRVPNTMPDITIQLPG